MLGEHLSSITAWLRFRVVIQDMLSACSGVKHGLCSCESLADNDKKCLFNIKSISGSEEIDWVNVGEELELHTLLNGSCLADWVVTKCLEDELRSEE